MKHFSCLGHADINAILTPSWLACQNDFADDWNRSSCVPVGISDMTQRIAVDKVVKFNEVVTLSELLWIFYT